MADSHSQDAALASDRGIVQLLLRTGLALSVVLMLAGAIVDLFSHQFTVTSVSLDQLLFIGTHSAHLTLGNRLMGLGILVLAATPAFRVVALLILWTRERDWRFVTVAAVVMTTLALSIILGRG